MNADRIVENYDKLKGQRANFEWHWQDVADHCIPWKDQVLRQSAPGIKKGWLIYDTTVMQSGELLTGALHGMLTNPSSIWFELTTGDEKLDEDDEVRAWLQDATLRANVEINNSNFQTQIHEFYTDEVFFGTAGLSIEEKQDGPSCLHFGSRSIAEIVVEENNLEKIDTVYRLIRWTARQVVQEFGDKVPDEIKQKADKLDPEPIEILHVVFPRDQKGMNEEFKKTPKGMKWASKWVLKAKKMELAEMGFHEFPYAIARWTKAWNEIYGRSPAMKCLADVKMINKMMETTIKAAQKSVDPPLAVPDDGYILPIRTTPGGINYYRSGTQDKIYPFANEYKVDIGQQMLNDIRSRIREAFYVDQFQLNQGPQMTATEVNQRTEEKMRLMGPILGRQHSELLMPTIERVFGIMLRRGKFNKPPKQLQGRNVQVRYSSLLARAQRITEAQNILRAVQALNPFVQADPTIMDNVDGDKAARYIMTDLYGLPEKMMRDKDAVNEIRKSRAQAQDKQNQQQDASHQADVIQKVAPALAQAQLATKARNQGG